MESFRRISPKNKKVTPKDSGISPKDKKISPKDSRISPKDKLRKQMQGIRWRRYENWGVVAR